MFGPNYTAGCPACSAIADGFNGFVVHLANHDVTFSAISRAPLAKPVALPEPEPKTLMDRIFENQHTFRLSNSFALHVIANPNVP